MAKRDKGNTWATEDTSTTDASGATTANAMEQRLVAFAEQLGRIAGTVHAKAEGWMDREALSKQVASVRDAAVDVLEQLAGAATRTSKKKQVAAVPRGGAKGRSGGLVDAPGKKHRKPMPSDPDAARSRSQAAKTRAAKTMIKTNKRRGRG